MKKRKKLTAPASERRNAVSKNGKKGDSGNKERKRIRQAVQALTVGGVGEKETEPKKSTGKRIEIEKTEWKKDLFGNDRLPGGKRVKKRKKKAIQKWGLVGNRI